MINNVAKKYVKALVEKQSKNEINNVIQTLDIVAKAFGVEKFNDIVNSPFISEDEKIELICSFIKDPTEKFKNFIKILAQNQRLELIPQIVEGLKSNISFMNNEFSCKIYSNQEISKVKIKELEENFSKKFDAKIKLIPILSNYDGIKIDLEDLGFEVSFSIDRLKAKMSEYILKAI